MKIKWLQDVTLNVVEHYDEKTDHAEEDEVSFAKDGVTEFDIFGDRGDTVNIQFGDGSVAYGISKALYEVVEIDELEVERRLEENRRDEKNGLYGGVQDDAN